MSEEPSKAAKVLMFFCTCFCITIFIIPICAIIYHCSSCYEAERRWKETQAIEQEKTNKSIREYNNFVEKMRFHNEEIELKELKKQIEKERDLK